MGPEVDHSPASSAEVKNEWSYTFTVCIWLNGMYRDNFLLQCLGCHYMKLTKNVQISSESLNLQI